MRRNAGVGRVTLQGVLNKVAEQKANITDIVFTDRKPDFYRMVIEIEVRDVKHLLHVQTAVEADTDVTDVMRYRRSLVDEADVLLAKD